MNLRDDDLVSAVALVMEGQAETAAKVEEGEETPSSRLRRRDAPADPGPSRKRLGREGQSARLRRRAA